LVAAADDLALLERHKPLLRFDRQYDYRLASVVGMVENPGNLLRAADGEVIARVGGDPALTLELLGAYPDGREPRADDCLCEAPDVLGDARGMEREPRYAGRLYGRVVRGDRGRDWLQYWFWLYYNPKNLFGFGKHEGDWEMIQIGLGADGEPEVLAYAQHASGEARRARDAEWIDRDGGTHPVVYVSPLSHASYFEAGTHPYPIGIDHPFGDGPEAWPEVEAFGEWVHWPGRWGNAERAIARRIGNGPHSPADQGSKWTSPARFQSKMGRRRLRASLGRLLHRLGRAFYPNPPELRARLDGTRCIVDYRMRDTRWRRSRHLYLTVHDGERVIASRAVRYAGESGTEILRPPVVPGTLNVLGTTFNRARQRSDLAETAVERTGNGD
jgi:Vacuolar protein sorting-associated protein 62